MALNTKQLRAKAANPGPKQVTVHVPEWDGEVTLKKMRSSEFLNIQAQLAELPKDENGNVQLSGGESVEKFLIAIVVAAAVNDDGSPLFENAEDAEILSTSPHALSLLGNAAMEINGFKAKEPAAKNDNPAPSETLP